MVSPQKMSSSCRERARAAGRTHCAADEVPVNYLTMNVTTPEAISGGQPPPARSSGQAERILVVDDDPGAAAGIAEILRARGFEVVVAPDYRLALEELESARRVDLMVADIVMPQRVNGIALSRMARMRRPGLKVVYITAYDIPGVEREALGPVLRKPVPDQDLLAQVECTLAAS
jgi:CheY-like chemotaxis protein